MHDSASAEPLYQKVVQIRKDTVGEKHVDYGTALNNLANAYFQRQDYASAEPLYQQVIENRRDNFGEKNADYATALNNLGWLYRLTGDFAKAEPLAAASASKFARKCSARSIATTP